MKLEQTCEDEKSNFLSLPAGHVLFAQQPTVGLISTSDMTADGYTLFAPLQSTSTYLINNDGYYRTGENGVFSAPKALWIYSDPEPQDFFANNISGAQRLINGNTLICNGPSGEFFEVDENKNLVWEYINPVGQNGAMEQGTTAGGSNRTKTNRVFRCTRYSPDYPAFAGKDLTPGEPTE